MLLFRCIFVSNKPTAGVLGFAWYSKQSPPTVNIILWVSFLCGLMSNEITIGDFGLVGYLAVFNKYYGVCTFYSFDRDLYLVMPWVSLPNLLVRDVLHIVASIPCNNWSIDYLAHVSVW